MLFKILSNINLSKYSPTVVSLTTCGTIGPRLSQLGIPVVSLGINRRFPNPLLFFRLVRILRRNKPVIVHCWMYHANLLGGLAARMAGVHRVAWGIRHSNFSGYRIKFSTSVVVRLGAFLSRWVPSLILFNSHRALEIHRKIGYYCSKSLVIPNGFDLKKFVPDSSVGASVKMELNLEIQTPLIGLIGRFDLQKNHLGFIEAARIVHQTRPDIHFLLAGTDVTQSNGLLRRAIEGVGLRQNFHLLGCRDDIPRLMAALDLLVSSSFTEAFSNVMGEAMACGVPCVMTDLGDAAQIIGKTGRVVKPGDMKMLAQSILELMQMPKPARRVLGQKARERIRKRFEIGKVANLHEEFYEQLLSPKTCI